MWFQWKFILSPPSRQFSLLSPGISLLSPGIIARHGHGFLRVPNLQANNVASYNCACCRFPSRGSILYGSKSSRHLWTTNYSDSGLKNSFQFEAPLLTRGYSTNNASESEKVTQLPSIMNIPEIIWPRLKSFSDWLFSTIKIGSHLDREFNLMDFLEGAKQAVILISEKLSKGEYEDLEELIEPSALEEIKKNMTNFNDAQREVLKVEEKNMFFSFPYEIKINGLDSDAPRVEITAVFHVLRGKGMSADDEEGQPKNLSQFVDERNRVMICNYRFYRDFIKGRDTSWIVSAVNHFVPPPSAGMYY